MTADQINLVTFSGITYIFIGFIMLFNIICKKSKITWLNLITMILFLPSTIAILILVGIIMLIEVLNKPIRKDK